MQPDQEPVADAAMDAKMRELWAKFSKRTWVRKQLADSLPPTRVTSMGCDFIVHPRDNFTEFRIWENGLPPEHEATQSIADRLAGSDAVIVDVGANAGAFFLPILRAAGDKARAVVFEPNPVMRARLQTNIALNALENVTVFDCAISDAAGTSKMFFPRNGNLGQGRIDLSYAGEGEGSTVRVRPLAECLTEAGVGRVDFLKVDVEGLEDRVIAPLLAGATTLLPRLIYFEVEHQAAWHYPLLEILAEKGYAECQSFDKNKLFEQRT